MTEGKIPVNKKDSRKICRIFNYFESQKIKSGIFLKSLIKIDLKLKTEQLNKILYMC